jgi:probable phosphoglycerate mutase
VSGRLITILNNSTAQRTTAPGWPPPRELVAIRHGQSTANVAFAEAEATGALTVPITERDADLPLTALGRAQAAAAGRHLACAPPELVYCSPYLRARETLALILEAASPAAGIPVRYDERLRDRETGAFEMQTAPALRLKHPEEMARRDHVGPFYYRPPGGENFPDVALRIRSLLHDALPDAAGRRILLVGHDSTVLMLRLILDGLDEQHLSPIVDAGGVIGNCAVTRWTADGPALRLAEYNAADHLPAPPR